MRWRPAQHRPRVLSRGESVRYGIRNMGGGDELRLRKDLSDRSVGTLRERDWSFSSLCMSSVVEIAFLAPMA